ncbi:MAG: RNA 2',3'-cyclic phosphodiesterase [Kangiellaceae bacterium]|nr:RNA 2',3'-cyclic phosphodiesterase [Kangiellaceae bacterium]
MARLFFAIDLAQNTKDYLEKIQRQHHFLGHPISPHNFHITLKFLGYLPQDRIEELIDAITIPQIQPFQIQLSSLAYYPKAQIGCIEPNEGSAQLLELRNRILNNLATKKFPFKKDKNNYRPHVSLYRQCTPNTDLSTRYKFVAEVRSFSLMQSLFNDKGVYYHTIEEWPIYQPSLKEKILGKS